jgi:hypothetical protein
LAADALQAAHHTFNEERDPHVNALGVKGVGEIGITGTAGAVANAVWHATGVRVHLIGVRKALPTAPTCQAYARMNIFTGSLCWHFINEQVDCKKLTSMVGSEL